MSRHVLLALLAAASLASCAIGPDSSYVGELSAPGDARILAAGMVEFVSTQLPAASSTIALDPTPADQASNALTPAFTAALRRRGFAVADDRQAATSATHHLRYWVTPVDNGAPVDRRPHRGVPLLRSEHSGRPAGGGPLMVRQRAEASR
jgi:hypothetical protein